MEIYDYSDAFFAAVVVVLGAGAYAFLALDGFVVPYASLVGCSSPQKLNSEDSGALGLTLPFSLGIFRSRRGSRRPIHQFRLINAELQLTDYLVRLIRSPPSDLAIGDETQAQFSEIAGELCFALAETFRIIDQDLKNPKTRDWERAYRLFALLL